MTNQETKLVLAELETLVMKQVWKKGRATVHDVRDALKQTRKLAYTTILTTMRNLEKKGFLYRELEGRSHVYLAKVQQSAVQKNALSSLLHSLFGGSKELLVNALYEEENLSREEFEKLRESIMKIRHQEDNND